MASSDIEIKYELPDYSQSSVQPTGEDRRKSDKPEVTQVEKTTLEQSSESGNEDSGTEKEPETILCIYCPAVFQQRSQLIQHHKTSHKRPYHCSWCEKSFSFGHRLARHLRVHTGERPFKCAQCEVRFSDTSALRVHKRRRHSSSSKATRRFRCEICKKCFSTQANMRNHELLHPENESNKIVQRNANFVCTFCGRKYNHKRDHERHVGTHTKEKPYLCSICPKAYGDSAHLAKHQSEHKPKLPLSARAAAIIAGKTQKHKCTYCDKNFYTNASLNAHIRMHTGELPYSCTICPKKFNRKGSLTLHHLVHAKERPFVCTTCQKGFKFAHCLERHQLVHSGEFPFSCSHCDRKFKHKQSLDAHENMKHLDLEPVD